MENNTPEIEIEREFFFLTEDMRCKQVTAKSRFNYSPIGWFVPSERCTCEEGYNLFSNVSDLITAAKEQIARRQRVVDTLKLNLEAIDPNVTL